MDNDDNDIAPVVSSKIVDLHTDVADLEAKENRLDELIATCQQELRTLTQPMNKYPLKYIHLIEYNVLMFNVQVLCSLKFYVT